MLTLGKFAVGLFFDTKATVEKINEYRPVTAGIIIGVLGTMFSPYVSLFARINMGTASQADIITTLIKAGLGGPLFFLFGSLLTYYLGRLFRGRDGLLHFISMIGWSGVFSIVICLLLSVILLLGRRLNPSTTRLPVALGLTVFAAALLTAYSAVKGVYAEILLVSRSLKLPVWKSVILLLITGVPLFWLYDRLF